MVGAGRPGVGGQRPSRGLRLGGAIPIGFLDGGEIALEVLQAIGYRTTLKSATIISYNMQDYDFWGQGRLSHLLGRQLSLGATIRVITTPPPGRATTSAFGAKYALLSHLDRGGVEVLLNEKLHAKAYLFCDERDVTTAVVGSANLTARGFGLKGAPGDSLVEWAVVSGEGSVLRRALGFVERKIVSDSRTEGYGTWFSRRSAEIGEAGL